MPTLLFYKKPVVLNRDAHRDLKIRPSTSLGYAAATNSVPLAGSEFAAAARQFPILFVSDPSKKTFPIALLGLRKDENLFVEADGRWSGMYVPAFIRRYPYVLADKGNPADFNVCIDEGYPGFNTQEGEPLFAEDGTEGPMLKQAVEFLKSYQTEAARTEAFCAEVQRLDLLIPQAITVNPKGGAQFKLDGFSLIDEQRLMKLDDKEAGNLLRAGYMGWIYAHLLSTHNITELSARLDSRRKKSA